jgi:RNA polymerase sigma factor CnrH
MSAPRQNPPRFAAITKVGPRGGLTVGRLEHLFEELFSEQFGAALRAVQCFGVPNRHALDLAQDVFVHVFLSLHRYDPARPLKPWLKTITHRTVRDYLELGRTRERLTHTGQVEPIEAAHSPEQVLEARQRDELLERLLRGLDPRARAALELNALDDRTEAEIARMLGLSAGTVQSRVRRGREHLAAMARRLTVASGRDRPRLRTPGGPVSNGTRGGP